jgi:hypothetical protein
MRIMYTNNGIYQKRYKSNASSYEPGFFKIIWTYKEALCCRARHT